jgi:hypothetical protein
MRTGSKQAPQSNPDFRSGTKARKAGDCQLSRSEQVGLGIASAAVIAMLVFAIL